MIKITRDDGLKLLGLFTLATEHYRKCREFEFAINRALGREGNDQAQISDAIYCDRHTVADFYAALSNEGFTIDAAPPASVEKEEGR